MSTLTLELPDEEVELFKTWISGRGLTPESGFSELLSKVSNTTKGDKPFRLRELHPNVLALTGCIPDDGRDYKEYREDYLDYMERKHR